MRETISHYRILKQLGSGGMGEVYLAQDTLLDRKVAIKILPEEVAGDQHRLHRFVQEAKAASALNHANVAGIYELGEAEGIHFIVMEHVEGETLDSRIKGNPMNAEDITETAMQIADALDEAHSRGIIHRDIKPANIMITARGKLKVLDFGLAKITQSLTAENLSKIGTQTGTTPGLVMGTVPYMSPEQALGKNIDQRSDIFSTGVVLYQMATGRLPFSADTPTETINRIINVAPDAVSRFNYNIPGELERIIRKCLEKDPERRYQTARELLIDLRNFKRDSESGAIAAGKPRKSRAPIVFASAALIIVAIAFFWFFKQLSAPRAPEPTESARMAAAQKRKMIVVLPFENLGSAQDQYFAAGMTEEITSRLATVGDLGVISRTSAMQYDRTGKTIKQVGMDLGVDYVLEGTVRWASNRVRVTPQLIRVDDDTHVWSNIYDRVIDDVFTVQSEIAQNVIQQLGINLLQDQQEIITSSPTHNIEAYRVFLQGNDYRDRPGYERSYLDLAINNYQKAVELDPTFAAAHAELGRSHLTIYHEGLDSSPKRLASAKYAVDKALELNPDLAASHVALGYYRYHGMTDYEGALDAFRHALRLSPNTAGAIEAMAYVERRQGKFDESIAHLKQAIELNPRAVFLMQELGVIYTRLRKYDEADAYYQRALELVPDERYCYGLRYMNEIMWKGSTQSARKIIEEMERNIGRDAIFMPQFLLERDYSKALTILQNSNQEVMQEEAVYLPKKLVEARIYRYSHQDDLAKKAFEDARTFLEQKVKEAPENPAIHASLGITYAGLGRREEALREGKRALQLKPVSRDPFMGPTHVVDLAAIYTLLGDYDSALDQIEHALSIPAWFSVHLLELHPEWDPLRTHPRYKKIVQQ